MNESCVYVHKDNDGVVRYVGSGSIKRAFRTYPNSDRGKRYSEYVKLNGKLNVEILFENLNKIEAENIERKLYDEYLTTLLNINRPTSYIQIESELISKYLYYDETSDSCLRWRINSKNNKNKADSVAGSIDTSKNYYIVMIENKSYYCHRLVMTLHGINVNGFVVDHIDRIRTNNKVSNLRAVSQQLNMYNVGIQKNNKTGVVGVCWHKGTMSWNAQWKENGKVCGKFFNPKNFISSEEAFEAACKYRSKMVEIHYPKID